MTDYSTREYIIRETTYPDATKQEVIGELVRCKDCKYHHYQNGIPYCDRYYWGWKDDDFCSSGERKGGKGNGNETD